MQLDVHLVTSMSVKYVPIIDKEFSAGSCKEEKKKYQAVFDS